MEQMLTLSEEILDRHVSGFHQYILREPVHLSFVSQSLCDMLGYTKDELLCDDGDRYATLVYPNDSALYSDFIQKLAQTENTVTVHYRLVRKDGSVCFVGDTASSRRLEDGTPVAYSVLNDLTEIIGEFHNLRYLNETIPCGYIKFTCDKQPKVIYANEQLLTMLRYPKDREQDDGELYRDNIYLMIPPEERRKFSNFLDRVSEKGAPLTGEINVLRFDGTKVRLFGWVTRTANERGEAEYHSICMDITEQYKEKKAHVTEPYLKALSEVYDRILEYDFVNKNVKFLHGYASDTFGNLQSISMQAEEATEQWIQSGVYRKDRKKVAAFFKDVFTRQTAVNDDGKPRQIRYRSLTASEELKESVGIFLKIDDSISLFCCRNIPDEHEADTLRTENKLLRLFNKNIQELVMRYTDGMLAFEVYHDTVKPLYASDNVCHFFGYSKEEWIALSQKRHSIKSFVAQSNVAYEDFEALLETGEAEFSYLDVKTNTTQRIKAVCSQKTPDADTPRYVMLYNINGNVRQKPEHAAEEPRVYIRTFGYFDVFVDGNPIAFRNEKSKELFALLVDRRGGYVTSAEAIGFLWENEPANAITLARYRKVALRLKNILEEYGIADAVESVDGKRRIVTDKVRCDLYDYLSQKEEYAQLFKGSYLSNYSWGETTLGELMRK